MELFDIVQGSRIGPMLQQMGAGGMGPVDPNEARMRILAEAIVEEPELLVVPDMVLAFKVKDQAAGETRSSGWKWSPRWRSSSPRPKSN